MMLSDVGSLSESAKELCRKIIEIDKESILRIPRPPKRERLVVNGSDYITDQDSEETRREKWQAFDELEKADVLSVKSVNVVNGSTEYRIQRALANNIR